MRIKYTKELMDSMNIFSRVTHALVKDCFESEGVLYFVVQPGQIGKAIGKGGSTIRELQNKLKKDIKLIEFNPNVKEFIKNVVHPLRVDSVDEEDNVVVLRSEDRRVKGLLIGRNAKNLNMLKAVVRRYFEIEDIKVE